MKNLIENPNFYKILIISGDGDYKKMIDYLIIKNRFEKILFPNRRFASSLYNHLGNKYFDYLEKTGIKGNIMLSRKNFNK